MRRFLVLALLLGAAPARAGDWQDLLNQDGVRVFVREAEGSRVKAVMAHAVVDSPPEQVFAVLGDVEAYPELIPPTESARLVRREGSAALFYMVIRPPLISRRDYCIRVVPSRLAGGRLKSEWRMSDDGCPLPRPGLVRMVRNEGSWLLTPIQGGRATHVIYEAHADPGGAVPVWMVNLATARTLPRIISSLRRAAALPRYASCRSDGTGCRQTGR